MPRQPSAHPSAHLIQHQQRAVLKAQGTAVYEIQQAARGTHNQGGPKAAQGLMLALGVGTADRLLRELLLIWRQQGARDTQDLHA